MKYLGALGVNTSTTLAPDVACYFAQTDGQAGFRSDSDEAVRKQHVGAIVNNNLIHIGKAKRWVEPGYPDLGF